MLDELLAEPMDHYTRLAEQAATATPTELLAAFIDFYERSHALIPIVGADPSVRALLDGRLPRTPADMFADVIAALAGPNPERAALLRAHAAFAVVKEATAAALRMDDGVLSDATAWTILAIATRTLRVMTELDEPKTAGTVRLGVLLGVVGGFLDAFTYVAHNGVFSNAQTGNMVLVGIFAARGDWARVLRQLLPLLAFVVGVFTAETMTHPKVRAWVRRPMRAALIAEIVVMVAVAFVPDGTAGYRGGDPGVVCGRRAELDVRHAAEVAVQHGHVDREHAHHDPFALPGGWCCGPRVRATRRAVSPWSASLS